MQTLDFSTSLLVAQSQQEVFDAVCQPQLWWPGEISGSSEKIGDEFSYRYQTLHFSRQKVMELVAGKKLVWLVTESELSFISNTGEWTGTKIIFEISPEGHNTLLNFIHEGLDPEVECFKACSNGWNQIIHQSLYQLLSTGEGRNLTLG